MHQFWRLFGTVYFAISPGTILICNCFTFLDIAISPGTIQICTCVLCLGGSHLKHDLSKLFIVVLPELPEHDAAELREVDMAVLGNLIIMLLVMTVMAMVMVTMMMY